MEKYRRRSERRKEEKKENEIFITPGKAKAHKSNTLFLFQERNVEGYQPPNNTIPEETSTSSPAPRRKGRGRGRGNDRGRSRGAQSKFKGRKIWKECKICLEEKSNFPKETEKCLHDQTSCKNCVESYLNSWLSGEQCGLVSEIKCSSYSCTSIFFENDLKKILRPRMFERWQNLTLNEWIQGQPNFRYCSNPVCGSGSLIDEESVFFKCEKCQTITCCFHRIPFHFGITCSQYDEKNEKLNEIYLSSNTKSCPKCTVAIEKNGGCAHMKCSNCRYEFCWRCMADFDKIRKNGNHHHKPTCHFYFFYQSDGEEDSDEDSGEDIYEAIFFENFQETTPTRIPRSPSRVVEKTPGRIPEPPPMGVPVRRTFDPQITPRSGEVDNETEIFFSMFSTSQSDKFRRGKRIRKSTNFALPEKNKRKRNK